MAFSPARKYIAASSQYHSISNAAQTGLSPADTNFYVAGWVYLDSVGTSRIIFSKWVSGGGSNAYQLAYNTSTGNFRWIGSTDGSSLSYDVNTGAGITTATWYFIEAYYNTTNNLFGICLNRGTDVTTAATTGLYASSTAAVVIGAQDGPTFPWDGRIQGMMVIGTSVPSAAERNSIYNSGSGVLYSNRPSLSSGTYVSFWNGDEASGNLIDSAGPNNMTDNGGVTTAAGIIVIPSGSATFGEIMSNTVIGASQSVRRNAGDTAFEAYTPVTAPAGSTTQVQFNDAGAFAGDANFVFNKTNDNLYVGSVAAILPGTVNRTSNLVSSVVLTGGKTITVTRSGNLISSFTDGTKTWTFTRNGSNQITSWAVA